MAGLGLGSGLGVRLSFSLAGPKALETNTGVQLERRNKFSCPIAQWESMVEIINHLIINFKIIGREDFECS